MPGRETEGVSGMGEGAVNTKIKDLAPGIGYVGFVGVEMGEVVNCCFIL